MKARFMIEEPGNCDGTIKITMPIKDWENLRDDLALIPSRTMLITELSNLISDLIRQARTVFYPKPKGEE